ncbi:MAG: hypothetical protein R3E93_07725 [Thiothrix sp.]
MQCRICGSEGEHRSYVAKEMMLGLRDEHRYFQCTDCECLQIEHAPDNLADYYPENYYSYHDPGKTGNPLQQALIRMRDRYEVTGKNQLGRIMHLLSPHAKLASLRPAKLSWDDRILDVGCGAGHCCTPCVKRVSATCWALTHSTVRTLPTPMACGSKSATFSASMGNGIW